MAKGHLFFPHLWACRGMSGHCRTFVVFRVKIQSLRGPSATVTGRKGDAHRRLSTQPGPLFRHKFHFCSSKPAAGTVSGPEFSCFFVRLFTSFFTRGRGSEEGGTGRGNREELETSKPENINTEQGPRQDEKQKEQLAKVPGNIVRKSCARTTGKNTEQNRKSKMTTRRRRTELEKTSASTSNEI